MTAVNPEASRQAVVEAALVLLERMGLTPADLSAQNISSGVTFCVPLAKIGFQPDSFLFGVGLGARLDGEMNAPAGCAASGRGRDPRDGQYLPLLAALREPSC